MYYTQQINSSIKMILLKMDIEWKVHKKTKFIDFSRSKVIDILMIFLPEPNRTYCFFMFAKIIFFYD